MAGVGSTRRKWREMKSKEGIADHVEKIVAVSQGGWKVEM